MLAATEAHQQEARCGIPYLHDYGRHGGPIGITNTNSVGLVRDAIGEWRNATFGDGSPLSFSFGLPIVAETWDGFLNDINGYHVKKEHVFQALNGAAGGRLAEGSVGGGTGMMSYYLKAGTGTASRIITIGSTPTRLVSSCRPTSAGWRTS